MKRIKKDMGGMVITSSELVKDIKDNKLNDKKIEGYIKEGLGFCFEEYCIDCDNVVCSCGAVKETTPKRNKRKLKNKYE